MINWELLMKLVNDNGEAQHKDKKYIKPEIRKKIKERDKVCQMCGRENTYTNEGNSSLHLHHILINGESSEDNLILLCRYCHQATHCLLFVSGKGFFANVLRGNI